MKKQHAVFIGRFQPYHIGHAKILQAALNDAENVIIVIGSAFAAPNTKNPWTAKEREEMILSTLKPEQKARVKFAYLNDRPYNETMWQTDIQNIVAELSDFTEDKNIGLIYCPTDKSSEYLETFPQWERISYTFNEANCHATKIRELYFKMDVQFKDHLHPNVIEYLERFRDTPSFKSLKDEFDYLEYYREQWRGAPFPVIFTTTDACVIRSGHVLLVKRKGYPGRGLWALPGGFLAQNEAIIDGMLRELKEETSIALPKSELRKCIADRMVADAVDRSLRGRTVSHAFLINLGSGALDRVKGFDDAQKAKWHPIDIALGMSESLFEDHHAIISHFVSRI